MQTIRERINEKTAINCRIHAQKLKDIKAPSIVCERALEIADYADNDQLKFVGEVSLLELEFSKEEVLTGNGGKRYTKFTTIEGLVGYFPNAKYGRYLTKLNK